MSFGRRNLASTTTNAAIAPPEVDTNWHTPTPGERRFSCEITAIVGTLAILGLGLLLQSAFESEQASAMQRLNRVEFYLLLFGLAAPWLLLRDLLGLPKFSQKENNSNTGDSSSGWFDGGSCGSGGDEGATATELRIALFAPQRAA